MRQKRNLEDNMEAVYKTKIRYKCPTRGWVEEEVEVKRFKAIDPPEGIPFDAEIDSVPIEETDS